MHGAIEMLVEMLLTGAAVGKCKGGPAAARRRHHAACRWALLAGTASRRVATNRRNRIAKRAEATGGATLQDAFGAGPCQ